MRPSDRSEGDPCLKNIWEHTVAEEQLCQAELLDFTHLEEVTGAFLERHRDDEQVEGYGDCRNDEL